MRILIALFLLGAMLPAGAEMSRFISPEYELKKSEVYIVWSDSVREMRKAVLSYCPGCTEVNGAVAYSFFDNRGADGEDRCVIFTVRPKQYEDDRFMSLGHEMMHCMTGDFHK